MNDSDFVARLQARSRHFGVGISAAHARELEKFYVLLAKWNRRINLTALDVGPVPPDETLDRLFIEPILASQLISDTPGAAIDLGSGAGSPALPIKVLRPAMRLTLVEAKGRKAAFLREAVRTLGLRDVDVEQARFQALPASLSSEFDVAIVRALRVDDDLLATVADLLKTSGRFVMFGVDAAPPGFALRDSRTLPDGSLVVSCSPEFVS